MAKERQGDFRSRPPSSLKPIWATPILDVPLFSDRKPTNRTMKRLNDALSEIDSFGEKPVSRPEFEKTCWKRSRQKNLKWKFQL